MQFNHDAAQRIESRCLEADVVDIEHGFHAVEADFEIKASDWHAWQQQLAEAGAPGGMSFTASEKVTEIPAASPGTTVQLEIYGDAAWFSDDDLVDAGQYLAEVANVRVGRLLQFSHLPACRIIVEYVHESGGLSAAAMGVSIGLNLIAASIFAGVTRLLRKRKKPAATDVPTPQLIEAAVPQIELHRVSQPNGPTVQTLKIVTDDEEVLRRALDRLIEPAEHPEWSVAVWEDESDSWKEV